jgi:hypothetical protein
MDQFFVGVGQRAVSLTGPGGRGNWVAPRFQARQHPRSRYCPARETDESIPAGTESLRSNFSWPAVPYGTVPCTQTIVGAIEEFSR